jgi:hypothetical protein
VAVDLGAGLVERRHGRARQLKLAAGLECDALAVEGRADREVALLDRLPAEAGVELLKHLADLVVVHAAAVGEAEPELLVLRADAPAVTRLAARPYVLNEVLPAGGDGRALLGRVRGAHHTRSQAAPGGAGSQLTLTGPWSSGPQLLADRHACRHPEPLSIWRGRGACKEGGSLINERTDSYAE